MRARDANAVAGPHEPAAAVPEQPLATTADLASVAAKSDAWQAHIDSSPRMLAQRRRLQRVLGDAFRPRSGHRTGLPSPQPRSGANTVQRQLDWSAERLAEQAGPVSDDAGFTAVAAMLDEYLKLLDRRGDGPHLVTSLERLCFAAERCMTRGTQRTRPQEAAFQLFRDAAQERDRLAGIRNVAHQSPAFNDFRATANPPVPEVWIEAGKRIAKLVEGQLTSQLTLSQPLAVQITREHGQYREFSSGTSTYVVAAADVEEPHRRLLDDLFPVDPSPDHVRQGPIGDCFLLAPAASVAAMNPGLIRAMMREQGAEKVIVRLFEVAGTPGRKTFTPRYMAVDKSILKRSNGQPRYASGALWVQMLEKAYAMSGLGSRQGRANDRNTYENLEGGRSDEALEILLGREVRVDRLDGDDSDPENPRNEFRHHNRDDMPWSDAEMERIDLAAAGKAPWEDSVTHVWFGGDKDLTRRWRAFVKGDGIRNRFEDNQVLLRDRSRRSYEEAVTLEDIDETMSASGLPSGIKSAINQYLRDGQLLPGRRGTGRYTREHIALYEKVRKACMAGKAVTADTPGVISVDQTNSGESAREPKGGGLVGNHSYSVLAVKTEADVRYVQVRNPWGRYGRIYVAGASGVLAPQVVEQGDGRSWIELVDFQKRFKQINL
ncbi:C2 family cysteine protease [Mitsuaria sp. 7]|uniref:C2 family cysteine protease n=1 Tax=Mitsuaria sp. 7 TaxID=1658665 RepID=UPI0007DDDCAD|nr:C2 family cysteine protease [Mitsuaria sp. 7]ANH67559.1 hypothetical protein ABE85_08245 [Mitsuaria sp. 7]